ncbi:MAG: LamG domain-containing protein [Armatimonadota bacterium]
MQSERNINAYGIVSPIDTSLLPGCILALENDEGRPGVPRTNLIPADRVTFALLWVAYSGEHIALTQGQEIADITPNGATRILGDGAGTNILKYYTTISTSTAGIQYTSKIIVKNNAATTMQVGLSGAQAGVLKASVLAGETKEVVITTTGNGVASVQLVFYTLNANEVLDVLAYQPQINYGAEALAFDNSPAIPTVIPVRRIDRSGWGNHGVVSGVTPVYEKYGLSYSYDSVDDYINCGHGASLANLSKFSIEMWVYRKSQGEGNAGQYINKGGKILSSCATATSRIDFRRTFSTTAGYWYSPSGSIITNKWQHIVICYDGSDVNNDPQFYIDGVLTATTRNVAPVGTISTVNDANDDLYIGNKADNNGTFDGRFGIVTAYNRIISATEVRMLRKKNALKYGQAA